MDRDGQRQRGHARSGAAGPPGLELLGAAAVVAEAAGLNNIDVSPACSWPRRPYSVLLSVVTGVFRVRVPLRPIHLSILFGSRLACPPSSSRGAELRRVSEVSATGARPRLCRRVCDRTRDHRGLRIAQLDDSIDSATPHSGRASRGLVCADELYRGGTAAEHVRATLVSRCRAVRPRHSPCHEPRPVRAAAARQPGVRPGRRVHRRRVPLLVLWRSADRHWRTRPVERDATHERRSTASSHCRGSRRCGLDAQPLPGPSRDVARSYRVALDGGESSSPRPTSARLPGSSSPRPQACAGARGERTAGARRHCRPRRVGPNDEGPTALLVMDWIDEARERLQTS